MSDEDGKIENHSQVLLREIRDRLGRIEGTQAEFRAMLAEHTGDARAGRRHASFEPKVFSGKRIHEGSQGGHCKPAEASADVERAVARLNAIDGRLGLIEGRVGLVPRLAHPPPYKPVLRRQFSDYCNASCAGHRGCKCCGMSA